MIKHIVMWKLLEQACDQSKDENALIIKEKLESLKGKIPQIVDIEVGINCLDDAAAFDVVLYSTFDSLEDLATYQINPMHQEIATFIGKVRENRIVVDYEV